MRASSHSKNSSNLKHKFRQLIKTLRSKTDFNNKAHLSFNSVLEPLQAELDKHVSDIMPTTLYESKSKNLSNDSCIITPFASETHEGSQCLKHRQDSQIEIEDNQDDYEIEKSLVRSKPIYLSPSTVLQCPAREGRIKQTQKYTSCIRQKNSKGKHINSVQISNNIKESKQQTVPFRGIKRSVPIKELDDLQLIKYWNKHTKLTESTTSAEIYQYFQQMMDELGIEVDGPIIMKFKNCIYFGERKSEGCCYQGIIYYFSGKLYYGEFLNSIKHGHGVQINFNNSIKYAGVFNRGAKNGFFFVQKQKQNYEGVLFNGLYHGQGKLITEDYVYTGSFTGGKKHGYGKQIYPKTGLRIEGYFQQGEYQSLTQTSRQTQPLLVSGKREISTLNKCQSVDTRIELTSKLMKRECSQILNRSNSNSGSNRGQNQLQFQDSRSLFDILQRKNSKQSKYDLYLDQLRKKQPRTKKEGSIKQSDRQNQSIIHRVYVNNEEQNDDAPSMFRQAQRPAFYSVQKQFCTSNERLRIRKRRMETPLVQK